MARWVNTGGVAEKIPQRVLLAVPSGLPIHRYSYNVGEKSLPCDRSAICRPIRHPRIPCPIPNVAALRPGVVVADQIPIFLAEGAVSRVPPSPVYANLSLLDPTEILLWSEVSLLEERTSLDSFAIIGGRTRPDRLTKADDVELSHSRPHFRTPTVADMLELGYLLCCCNSQVRANHLVTKQDRRSPCPDFPGEKGI